MLLNPSIQFFIDAQGLLLIGRKGMHYPQLKFTCVSNNMLFSYASYSENTQVYQNLLLISSSPRCFLEIHSAGMLSDLACAE